MNNYCFIQKSVIPLPYKIETQIVMRHFYKSNKINTTLRMDAYSTTYTVGTTKVIVVKSENKIYIDGSLYDISYAENKTALVAAAYNHSGYNGGYKRMHDDFVVFLYAIGAIATGTELDQIMERARKDVQEWKDLVNKIFNF